MKDNHTPWKWGKNVISTRHISGQGCSPRMVSNARILWNEETGEIAVESLFEPSRVHQRLLSATLNSYHQNCGNRAVECAESDLLGECLGALREILVIANKNSNNHYNPEPRISTIAKAILAKRKDSER